MTSMCAEGFRKGFYDPLVKNFPGAGYSEFNDGYLPKAVAKYAPEFNGWQQYSFLPLFGSHQSIAYYHGFGQISWQGRNDGTNPDFLASPMPTLIWETQTARVHTAASELPQIPWIAGKSYRGDSPDQASHFVIANTPYYEEGLWHIMMCSNTTNVLYWNTREQNSRPGFSKFDADNAALDADLAEFAKEADNAPSIHCLTLDNVPFNSKILVSGVECQGAHGKRKLFRVTLSSGEKTATVTLPGETQPREIKLEGDQVGTWIVVNE
jgi:hypothetical protein